MDLIPEPESRIRPTPSGTSELIRDNGGGVTT